MSLSSGEWLDSTQRRLASKHEQLSHHKRYMVLNVDVSIRSDLALAQGKSCLIFLHDGEYHYGLPIASTRRKFVSSSCSELFMAVTHCEVHMTASNRRNFIWQVTLYRQSINTGIR